MTDEEIQAAYDETVTPPYEHACWLAFARRIAEIERERCAKVCEEEDVAATDDPLGVQECIAKSIRSLVDEND